MESSAEARERKTMRLPLLALHISAGSIGLLSGAAGISFRKGSERYRLGQQPVFPEAIRKQYLRAPLAILSFPPMIFWLLRVLSAREWLVGYVPQIRGRARAFLLQKSGNKRRVPTISRRFIRLQR